MLPQFELYTFFIDQFFFQVQIYNTSIFTIRTIPWSSFDVIQYQGQNEFEKVMSYIPTVA